MTAKLTHIDQDGSAIMVDVAAKTPSLRQAEAFGKVYMSAEALKAISDGTAKKGDVLAVARIAGIMAAKQTSSLIPLCHQLALTKAKVDFQLNNEKNCVEIKSLVKTFHSTGVEMEALTAVSVAALTIYDMLKAIDKQMVITEIMLLSKSK